MKTVFALLGTLAGSLVGLYIILFTHTISDPEQMACEKAVDIVMKDHNKSNPQLTKTAVLECLTQVNHLRLQRGDEVYNQVLQCLEKANNKEELELCDSI